MRVFKGLIVLYFLLIIVLYFLLIAVAPAFGEKIKIIDPNVNIMPDDSVSEYFYPGRPEFIVTVTIEYRGIFGVYIPEIVGGYLSTTDERAKIEFKIEEDVPPFPGDCR